MPVTGSAVRKLEAITGGKVEKTVARWLLTVQCDRKVAYNANTEFEFSTDKKSEKLACQELERQHWAWLTLFIFYSQGYRCFDCRAIRPLQGHHKIYRSRWSREDGPRDSEKNVVGICAACHETRHRNNADGKAL